MESHSKAVIKFELTEGLEAVHICLIGRLQCHSNRQHGMDVNSLESTDDRLKDFSVLRFNMARVTFNTPLLQSFMFSSP